jgi:DNA-binding transcriptional LysR family regulator
MKSPPLNALYAFEAFARRGGMSIAADELCVTHGAVSRHIRQLEARLGVALVHGPKNRLALTEIGLVLADQLTTAFRIVESALPAHADASRHNLHVSCLGTFAMKWLIPRLPRFHDAHPQVQVRITESYLPCDFRRDAVDLAIRTSDGDGMADSTPFLEQFHGPVLAPHLLTKHHDLRTVLAALPRLHAQSYPRSWEEWRTNSGIRLDHSPSERAFEHNAYMIEAAVAGLGAAVCPWAFVMNDMAQGRLAAPLGFVATHTHYVAQHPRGGCSPAARKFRDWLLEEGRNTPGPPSAQRDI